MIPSYLKRLFALFIVVAMTLSIVACNPSKTPDTDTGSESESIKETEKETSSENDSKTDEKTESEQTTDSGSAAESDDATESNKQSESSGATESSGTTANGTESGTVTESQSESESASDVVSESTSETTSETLGGTEVETDCEHPYAANKDGHWKPACDVCGKGEGKMQDHEIYEKIKDQGDRLAYLYLCSVCGFVVFKQELSYDINVYIPPTDLAATRCYNYSPAYYFEDNVGYTRFSSSGSNGIIYAYEDTSCDDVSGRYLIMKVRMSGGSSIKLNIKSINAVSDISVTPCEISDEWCTLIIDMAAIGNGKTTGYVPDGGGDYYLSLLNIYLSDNTMLPAGGYIDISYITVVETMEDAREFVDESDILYIYDNVMMNPFPSIEGALCKHEYTYDDNKHSMPACENCGAEAIVDVPHSIIESVSDGVYSYACPCGYKYDTSKTVSSAVNTFLSPSYIAKHADNTACWSGGELIYENGNEPFARIYGKNKDAAGKMITDDKKVWNVYSNGIAVTGQYLVIKYRIPDNNLIYTADSTSKFNQSQIRIYTSTQRNMATDEKDGFYLPVSENNEWQVAIINLAFSVGNSSGSTFVAAEDGTYSMRFMQLRLFYGGFSTESDYTDIAYIGFCDKLEEAVSLVNEDQYYWQCTKGERKGYTVNKAEGPNPDDEIPETESEMVTEPVEELVIK
ncbi:MAG: hypothetical protein J6L83_02880 [Clostridia bacterium]|nr:hypothetical protein [Clostridia bacterium]